MKNAAPILHASPPPENYGTRSLRRLEQVLYFPIHLANEPRGGGGQARLVKGPSPSRVSRAPNSLCACVLSPEKRKILVCRNDLKKSEIIIVQFRSLDMMQPHFRSFSTFGDCCWETYSALRNTTCLTLNIVMETLIACTFKEIRNVLSWQVNCFWMLRAWCDKNMTDRYLVTKMPRLSIRKESCYD